MVALVTCKNEEDPFKNEGARVLTTLYINFSEAQWQLTLSSVVGSGRNSNSSKFFIVLIICKNEEKEALQWFQHFSHYKYNMDIFSRRSRLAYSAVRGRI